MEYLSSFSQEIQDMDDQILEARIKKQNSLEKLKEIEKQCVKEQDIIIEILERKKRKHPMFSTTEKNIEVQHPLKSTVKKVHSSRSWLRKPKVVENQV